MTVDVDGFLATSDGSQNLILLPMDSIFKTLDDYKIVKRKNMKDKIGFNIGFAIIASPIGLGLLREFDFHNFVFRNQV